MNIFFLFFALLLFEQSAVAGAVDPIRPTFPSVPSAYQSVEAGQLIAESRINFGYKPVETETNVQEQSFAEVNRTNGYQVISPDGQTFYVDNITQPKCAFYATYVTVENDNQIVMGVEVVSNVYVDQINFENCQ
jgi:hypothetical protein